MQLWDKCGKLGSSPGEALEHALGNEEWDLPDTQARARDEERGVRAQQGTPGIERQRALLDFGGWELVCGWAVREDDCQDVRAKG